MSRPANALILNGLKGVERQNMINQITASQPLLKRLEELLKKELESETEPDFDNPSWAYRQAFEIGYKKGLTRVLKYVIINGV
jgi:hypothetical protein